MGMGLVNEWCQFVEHVGAATAERGGKFYYVGLDLGQAADYSALAILERHGKEDDCEFRCRHLQRWALKTPYPAIVADTVRMMNSAELRATDQPTLAVDATGVGAPVVDLFKRERMSAAFYPVTITGGDTPSYDSGAWRVPKRVAGFRYSSAATPSRCKSANSSKVGDFKPRTLNKLMTA